MANTLLLKYNSTSGAVPTASTVKVRELAINTADGVIYTQKSDGTIKAINPLFGPAPQTVTVDFGSIPSNAQSFTSTVNGVTTSMMVQATVSGSSAYGAYPDELEMEPLNVYASVTAANTIFFTVTCTDPILVTAGKKIINFYVG